MLPLVYHPNYSCPFPTQHRFVMSKFRRLYDYCREQQLIHSANHFTPQTASIEDLAIAHHTQYLRDLQEQTFDSKVWRRIGLPWSEGLIERTFTAPNGTLLTAQLALQQGMACHLAGGTHHAHYDFGSGFCLLNDLAYTAKTLQQQGHIKRALIFDLDVHQGDGTAAILQDESDLFTCSIHCEKNFPFRKSVSDLDVGLEKGLADQGYLDIVDSTLKRLLEQVEPDIVLYDAGIDVWQDDELGYLDISQQGIEERDRLVLETCLQRHIPVLTVIGGGYDSDHQRLARRHASIIETASELFPRYL